MFLSNIQSPCRKRIGTAALKERRRKRKEKKRNIFTFTVYTHSGRSLMGYHECAFLTPTKIEPCSRTCRPKGTTRIVTSALWNSSFKHHDSNTLTFNCQSKSCSWAEEIAFTLSTSAFLISSFLPFRHFVIASWQFEFNSFICWAAYKNKNWDCLNYEPQK